MYRTSPFTGIPRIVLVWVNPLITGSNALRYDLVGYVFRQGVGAEAKGTVSPQPFGFRANAAPVQIPYDAMIRITGDLATTLLVPLSLRVAQLFRNRSWVRTLFQVQSSAQGNFESYPIEGTPYSTYQAALALNGSLMSRLRSPI